MGNVYNKGLGVVTPFIIAAILIAGGAGAYFIFFRKKKPSPAVIPGFVMVGDSIISRMAEFQSKLPPPFNTAINLGIAGAPTSQIKGTVPTGAAAILIEGGIDNFISNTESSIISDYAAMLAAIPATTSIIVLGIIQLDEAMLKPPYDTLLSNTKVASANAGINALCAGRPNCRIARSVQNQSMTGLTIDGVHPTEQGYQVLTTLINSGA